MDKPTEAQIKEFWEWCGLVSREVTYQGKTWREWSNSDGGFESRYTPPIDLNNLFKYAVPLAIEELRHYKRNTLSVRSARDRLFRKWLCGYQEGVLDEYALFWTIWKVKSETVNS